MQYLTSKVKHLKVTVNEHLPHIEHSHTHMQREALNYVTYIPETGSPVGQLGKAIKDIFDILTLLQ